MNSISFYDELKERTKLHDRGQMYEFKLFSFFFILYTIRLLNKNQIDIVYTIYTLYSILFYINYMKNKLMYSYNEPFSKKLLELNSDQNVKNFTVNLYNSF